MISLPEDFPAPVDDAIQGGPRSSTPLEGALSVERRARHQEEGDQAFFHTGEQTEPSTIKVYSSNIQNDIANNLRAIANEIILEKNSWRLDAQALLAGEANYVHHVTYTVGTFALFATSRSVPVDSSYVSVSVSREIERERYRSVTEIETALRTQSAGNFDGCTSTGVDPLHALERSTRGFALIGNPGSGKTTTFRWIAIQIARGYQIYDKKRVAIYLAVRDLNVTTKISKDNVSERKPILDGIRRHLDSLGIDQLDTVMSMLLQTGRCVILIDGLDETEPEEQDAILQEMAIMHTRWPGCLICVSARPYSLGKAMPGFTKWETLSLSLQDRVTFVRKWFSHVDASKGERLILRCRSTPSLLDLGSSPLLLSIVCALFDHDLDIPSDPGELYGRAIEGMLGAWDAFRNIARRTPLASLSLRMRIALISSLAYDMFEKSKIVFSHRDVDASGCIKRIARTARVPVPVSEDVLTTLYNDFGVLVERSPGLYSFSHLTMQEYLVGRHIVDNRQEITLAARAGNPEWHEVIRVVARLLPQADEFMRTLHQATKLASRSSVALLSSVWKSMPICSEREQKILISQLAKGVGSTLASISSSFSIEEDTLYIIPKDVRRLALANEAMRRRLKDEPRKSGADATSDDVTSATSDARGKKKSGQRSRDYYPLALLECLPDMLEIISNCGFSYTELGVDSNVFFQFLSKQGNVKVIAVEIASRGEGMPAPPKQKRHANRPIT